MKGIGSLQLLILFCNNFLTRQSSARNLKAIHWQIFLGPGILSLRVEDKRQGIIFVDCPPQGMLKLNFDGSYVNNVRELNRAGIGGVFRDHSGALIQVQLMY